MAFYADTSALVKLVVEEQETSALRAWLTAHERDLVTCDLARTELVRAVRRSEPELARRAREVLDACLLMTVTAGVFDAAGRLEPVGLRPLDAIHLAAALELGDSLDAVVTYDERLAQAASSNGLAVLAPH